MNTFLPTGDFSMFIFFTYFTVILLICVLGLYMVYGFRHSSTLLFIGLKAEFAYWICFFIMLTQIDLTEYRESSLVAGIVYGLIRIFSVITAILFKSANKQDPLTYPQSDPDGLKNVKPKKKKPSKFCK